MNKFKLLSLFLLYFLVTKSFANIHSTFEQIKSEPEALFAFLHNMPKGGELHYHLAGGAYPETMIALAKKRHYCLELPSYAISHQKKNCQGVFSNRISTLSSLYRRIIEAWSMQDFTLTKESGHDHFFATFNKFREIVSDFSPQLLASVMTRAAEQNEYYLEVMVLPDNARSLNFSNLIQGLDFAKARKKLLNTPEYRKNIQFTTQETKFILQKAKENLQCNTSIRPLKKACQLTVKFQYYILREQPLEPFFSQALHAFEVAENSTDIVGINLVQPEDGALSLKYYRQQMKIIQFLHQFYPQVHIALHAGELTPKLVPTPDLKFHIHDAIFIGQAKRIGHGVDILHEENYKKTLEYMAKHGIAVEINLTSNEAILDIKGKAHPLLTYLAFQVPIVLSTDDEGILRTNLTTQYMEAVQQYNLDYATIKQINRNALTYSFMKGKSLWKNPTQQIRVKACSDLDNQTCYQFIALSEKARVQWQLEKALARFEQGLRKAPISSLK